MVAAIFFWWLALTLLGWVCWPLLAGMLPSMTDRGYAFAKAFGLLLVAYLYWLLGHLGVPLHLRVVWWGILALVTLLGVGMWVRQWRDLWTLLRAEYEHVITAEILFAVIFILGVVQVGYSASLLQGERPASFAAIMSVARSSSMPPQDLWMAGEVLPPPYWGYLIVALLMRATGTPGLVAYNLANAHTFALFVLVIYGLLYNVFSIKAASRRESARRLGILGALGVSLLGPLEGFFEYMQIRGAMPQWFLDWLQIPGLSQAPVTGGYVPIEPEWWQRAAHMFVASGGAGEGALLMTPFPVFSFLRGDLEPIYLALPFWGLALGMVLGMGLATEKDFLPWWKRPRFWAMGWLIGALAPFHFAAFPVVLLLVILVWYIEYARNVKKDLVHLAGPVVLILVAVVVCLPHYFALPKARFEFAIAQGSPIRLSHYFIFFAAWLMLIIGDVTLAYKQMRQSSSPLPRSLVFLMMLGLLGLCFLGGWIVGGSRAVVHRAAEIAKQPWLILFQTGAMSILLISLFRRQGVYRKVVREEFQDIEERLTRLLAFVGLGLTLIPEWCEVVLPLELRHLAMPSLYYLAWGLLGIAGISALPRLWNAYGGERALLWIAMLLLLVGCYYPIAAAWTQADAYEGEFTLDGLAFGEREAPGWARVRTWLLEKGMAGSVLIEGVPQDGNVWSGLLSATTGFPTVLGWPNYEAALHGKESVAERLADLDTLYRARDEAKVLAVLNKYRVRYLYVGPREREMYHITDPLIWQKAILRPVLLSDGHALYSVQ